MLIPTPLCTTSTWLFLATTTLGQVIAPSNNSQDLFPVSTSPRFLLNGTELPDLPPVRMAPLGDYARMSHSAFVEVEVDGHLVNVDATNANDDENTDQFSYLSCDPEAYTGNLDANDIFRIVVNQPRANIVILYSVTSDHCAATGLNNLPTINGILTTTEAMAATMLANLNLTKNSPGSVTILPDLNAYTNSSNDSGFASGSLGQSPTTAVAMIILYSITGIITALFVVIIVTGAIRAHRHPERYGPRTIIGRGRQSRARGIARAMLDTLPIVKFGDRDAPDNSRKPPAGTDTEMNANGDSRESASTNNAVTTGAVTGPETPPTELQSAGTAPNADGRDEEGQLGCSICTEDFTRGEEVRVLPCNHKFHPDCVDPWLLNVSGTCPLCRIDLRPQDKDGEDGGVSALHAGQDNSLPPPLAGETSTSVSERPQDAEPGSTRRDTLAQLRRMAGGSREDRIAALRRYRQERRARNGNRTDVEEDEGERRGLTRRLREGFRVRTERRGTGVDTLYDSRRRGTFAG